MLSAEARGAVEMRAVAADSTGYCLPTAVGGSSHVFKPGLRARSVHVAACPTGVLPAGAPQRTIVLCQSSDVGATPALHQAGTASDMHTIIPRMG